MIDGLRQRFCQQCGRFHDVGALAAAAAAAVAAAAAAVVAAAAAAVNIDIVQLSLPTMCFCIAYGLGWSRPCGPP